MVKSNGEGSEPPTPIASLLVLAYSMGMLTSWWLSKAVPAWYADLVSAVCR